MSTPPHEIHLDIAIIGGGVAGLWLANRIKSAGFSVALFESSALGSDQALASQGMIHGGMKYTLAGTLTGASEAIADMPKHWRACLCGEGDVDLRHTRILSDHFFMWSGDDLGSKITSFFASKITRGRVDAVHPDRRPPLLRHKDFAGSLYRLEDLVIDTPSLVANLANNIDGCCYQIDWQQAQLQRDSSGKIHLKIAATAGELCIHAQRFIFTAGKGNAQLLAELGLEQPAMQLRPLQQVMVKHQHPFDFYGHCLGREATPRLTISSHRLPDDTSI
jgi:glycerol-3-phosphate dehydrogenase